MTIDLEQLSTKYQPREYRIKKSKYCGYWIQYRQDAHDVWQQHDEVYITRWGAYCSAYLMALRHKWRYYHPKPIEVRVDEYTYLGRLP